MREQGHGRKGAELGVELAGATGIGVVEARLGGVACRPPWGVAGVQACLAHSACFPGAWMGWNFKRGEMREEVCMTWVCQGGPGRTGVQVW